MGSKSNCEPCYDNRVALDKKLRGLIRYRYDTSVYLNKLTNEFEETTVKHNVRNVWPFDNMLDDRLIQFIIKIQLENVKAFQSTIKEFPSHFHKQVCLSFIETDILYYNKWVSISIASVDNRYNNTGFISGMREIVKTLEGFYDLAQSIPVSGENITEPSTYYNSPRYDGITERRPFKSVRS